MNVDHANIVKRYMSNILKMEKSIPVKNPGTNSSFKKNLTNQDLERMLSLQKHKN